MRAVFVDTSAWCAYFDKSEANHFVTASQMNNSSFPLITSNYIIDETLTLLKTRIGHALTVTVAQKLFAGYFADMVWITEADVKSAFKIFARYADKAFSFTDCTSFAVMQNMGITRAFTFDKHFRQMGFQAVP